MKTLVLGATGIIGNHIVRELIRQGHEVSALSRGLKPMKNMEGLKAEYVRGDTNNLESLVKAFEGKDWVFYAAGYYPDNMFFMNRHVSTALKQARNVIEAALKTGVKRLIYTSSLTTIGQAAPGRLADESLPYDLYGKDPHPYFRLKHLVEQEFLKAYKEKSLPVVFVNPTGCFGDYELKPKEMCVIPRLATGQMPAAVNLPINVVDVADVAKGQILAAEKGRLGERYILGGHNLMGMQLMQEICSAIGAKPPKISVPAALAMGIANVSETVALLTRKPPFAPALGIRFIQYGQHFSIEKAKKELGYEPSPMAPCFQRGYQWYKQLGYC